MNRNQKHWFKIEMFCKIINIFMVTSDQFNKSLLNKTIHFLIFLSFLTPFFFKWEFIKIYRKILNSKNNVLNVISEMFLEQ